MIEFIERHRLASAAVLLWVAWEVHRIISAVVHVVYHSNDITGPVASCIAAIVALLGVATKFFTERRNAGNSPSS